MFEPFQDFLKKTANRYGLARQVDAAKICHDFRELIPEIFKNKETPEAYIKPAYFKDSILTVSVDSPAWGQEVIMRKPEIIDALNQKAGKQAIKNLRTQLRNEQNNGTIV